MVEDLDHALRFDDVYPIISPQRESHRPQALLGVTCCLEGTEQGNMNRPIAALLSLSLSAGHSSISHTPLIPPGEKSTELKPILNYRLLHTHTPTYTLKQERL